MKITIYYNISWALLKTAELLASDSYRRGRGRGEGKSACVYVCVCVEGGGGGEGEREITLMSSLHAAVSFTPGIKRLFLLSSIAITPNAY